MLKQNVAILDFSLLMTVFMQANIWKEKQ